MAAVRRSYTLAVGAVLVASFIGGVAQADATPACDAAPFHDFDFWVGDWEVVDADGKPAGTSHVQSMDEGCVILEEWRSARGNTGRSLNFFDPRSRSWRQVWVGLGIQLDMSGELRADGMVLEGPLYDLSSGKTTRLRGVWSKLSDGRVRQHFTESSDGGKTWGEWFDGYYTKRAPESAWKK